MPFTIEDTWLPAILTAPPMTDGAFADPVSAHPDLWFEMTASGELVTIPPNKPDAGARNADITTDLNLWARRDGRGRDKMREYIENGAQLGWLIDPERGAIEIFRSGLEPEGREGILGRVWNPWG